MPCPIGYELEVISWRQMQLKLGLQTIMFNFHLKK